MDETGDPGAYNPNANRELAHEAKASFGRSGSSGHGGFGSTTKEKRGDADGSVADCGGVDPKARQIIAEDTPGPGRYNTPISFAEGRGASGASSAFRSMSAQRLPPPNSEGLEEVGPAAYDVQFTQVAPVMGNPVTATAPRDSRFVGDFITNVGSETPQQVGPGTYDPQVLLSGEYATIARTVSEHVLVHGESGSVISDVLRNVFAWLLPGEQGEPINNALSA